MSDTLRIAVVVPMRELNRRARRCIEACTELTYEPRTVAVVTDAPIALPNDPHFTNLVTGAGHVTSLGEKARLAAKSLQAEAFAYLDDDAYPPPAWLDKAADVLREFPQAAGAGGPGLMPDDEIFWERVSSAVMESWLGSGPLRFRSWPQGARWCDDFPTFDLVLRRAWLDKAGGWSDDWIGGEDTVLGGRMADLGGFIRYDARLAVHHYRRVLVPKHASQMQNVGRSRGCFIRSRHARSFRAAFVGPPTFVVAALALIALPFFMRSGWPLGVAAIVLAYAALAAFAHPGRIGWPVRLALPLGLLVHHTAYSWGLLRGLITGKRATSTA